MEKAKGLYFKIRQHFCHIEFMDEMNAFSIDAAGHTLPLPTLTYEELLLLPATIIVG